MAAPEFQSTPARGGRPAGNTILVGVVLFQSTPARGGRQHRGATVPKHPGFNPRPRAAGDFSLPLPFAGFVSFQSTPARGGRLKFIRCE